MGLFSEDLSVELILAFTEFLEWILFHLWNKIILLIMEFLWFLPFQTLSI